MKHYRNQEVVYVLKSTQVQFTPNGPRVVAFYHTDEAVQVVIFKPHDTIPKIREVHYTDW